MLDLFLIFSKSFKKIVNSLATICTQLKHFSEEDISELQQLIFTCLQSLIYNLVKV